MTKYLSISFCLLLIACSDQYHLERDLSALIEASNEGNYRKAATLTHPGVFNKISVESFIDKSKEIQNTYGKLMITDYKIAPDNKLINYQDTIYSMVEYVAQMKIKITEPEGRQVVALLREFRKQFSPNNIQYDPQENTILIKAVNSIYAISVDRGEKWYFIENWMGFGDQPLYKMIIPEIVLSQLENGTRSGTISK